MKMRIFTVLFILGISFPAFAQDHSDVVRFVRSQLLVQGVDMSGPCGAFEITKRVAWELRGEGYGLLGGKSAGQNGCTVGTERYSVDWVLKADGHGADILTDAGGANGTMWSPDEADPKFYRPAFDPGDVVVIPPVDPPPPPVSETDLLILKAQMAALRGQVTDLYTQIRNMTDVIADIADRLTDASGEIVTLKSRPLPPSGCAVQFLRCRLVP